MINSRMLKIKRQLLHEKAKNRKIMKEVCYAFVVACFVYWLFLKWVEWYSMNYYFINR